MIIAPLSLLCAGWFFFCWIGAKIGSMVFKGFLGKTVNAAAWLWILPLVVGVIAAAKGV